MITPKCCNFNYDILHVLAQATFLSFMMQTFQEYLKHRISERLPGMDAQKLMAPLPVAGKLNARQFQPASEDFRNNSVLVPIINWKQIPEIVFTLRAQGINHGGQISFPGGGKEGDESIVETALREAQEEIGLRQTGVEIVGNLTPLYMGHSDNMITPVVAFLNNEQQFTPNPNEVEEIFAVSISELYKESNLANEEWNLRGVPFKVPFWKIHRVPLWGATAMMLSELLVLYRDYSQEMKKRSD